MSVIINEQRNGSEDQRTVECILYFVCGSSHPYSFSHPDDFFDRRLIVSADIVYYDDEYYSDYIYGTSIVRFDDASEYSIGIRMPGATDSATFDFLEANVYLESFRAGDFFETDVSTEIYDEVTEL